MKYKHLRYKKRGMGAAVADYLVEESLAQSKVQELNSEMKKLESLQAQVDAGIARIENPGLRAKFESERAESRGFFNQYVAPAWQKIINYSQSGVSWLTDLFSGSMADFGNNQSMGSSMADFGNTIYTPNDVRSIAYTQDRKEKGYWVPTPNWLPSKGDFGFLPAIPLGIIGVGVIASAGAAIYYIKAAQAREEAILNSSEFSAAQKQSLLQSGSASFNISESAKWIAVAAAALALIYLFSKRKTA